MTEKSSYNDSNMGYDGDQTRFQETRQTTQSPVTEYPNGHQITLEKNPYATVELSLYNPPKQEIPKDSLIHQQDTLILKLPGINGVEEDYVVAPHYSSQPDQCFTVLLNDNLELVQVFTNTDGAVKNWAVTPTENGLQVKEATPSRTKPDITIQTEPTKPNSITANTEQISTLTPATLPDAKDKKALLMPTEGFVSVGMKEIPETYIEAASSNYRFNLDAQGNVTIITQSHNKEIPNTETILKNGQANPIKLENDTLIVNYVAGKLIIKQIHPTQTNGANLGISLMRQSVIDKFPKPMEQTHLTAEPQTNGIFSQTLSGDSLFDGMIQIPPDENGFSKNVFFLKRTDGGVSAVIQRLDGNNSVKLDTPVTTIGDITITFDRDTMSATVSVDKNKHPEKEIKKPESTAFTQEKVPGAHANQDNMYINELGAFAVFDGVGSGEDSAKVSAAGTKALEQIFQHQTKPFESEQQAKDALLKVLLQMVTTAQTYPGENNQNASTFSCGLPFTKPDGSTGLAILNIGDSRIHRFRPSNGQFDQVTTDDNLFKPGSTFTDFLRSQGINMNAELTEQQANEINQFLLNVDFFKPESQLQTQALASVVGESLLPYILKFRNVITKAINALNPTDKTELLSIYQNNIQTIDVNPGDIFIASSDGVGDNTTQAEFRQVVTQNKDFYQLGNQLYNASLVREKYENPQAYKSDDTTIVAVKYP